MYYRNCLTEKEIDEGRKLPYGMHYVGLEDHPEVIAAYLNSRFRGEEITI